METAKILVRNLAGCPLPKEFRFDTDEVRIRRHGSAVFSNLSPATGLGWMRSSARWMTIAGGASGQPSEQQRSALDYFK